MHSPEDQSESGYTPLMPDNSPMPADRGRKGRASSWLRASFYRVKESLTPASSSQPREESGYLTLIPLSDSRLQPPRTKAVAGMIALLSILSALSVFFLVPRGVSVGTIEVHSHEVAFNRTEATYVVVLTTNIPVYNPNFLPVELSGSINVTFYDQEAGHTTLEATTIPRRTLPENLHLRLDASSVPKDYLLTIYTQCFTFPHKIIFFLKASLESKYLGATWRLPKIDNYFLIDCKEAASSVSGRTSTIARRLSDAQARDLGLWESNPPLR